MIDKVQKIREEVQRLKEIAEYNLSHGKMDRSAWMQQASVCTNLLSFIDSMQKESKFKVGDRVKSKIDGFPICTIESVDDTTYYCDYTNFDIIEQDGWELVVEPKDCMYSKDNYTDEDIKVLCDGCEEECKSNKKEEPVSEELIEELKKNVNIRVCVSKGIPVIKIAHHFAQWQKEQIIKRLRNHANIDKMVEKFEAKYKPQNVLDTACYKRGIFDTIKIIKEG